MISPLQRAWCVARRFTAVAIPPGDSARRCCRAMLLGDSAGRKRPGQARRRVILFFPDRFAPRFSTGLYLALDANLAVVVWASER